MHRLTLFDYRIEIRYLTAERQTVVELCGAGNLLVKLLCLRFAEMEMYINLDGD